MLKNIDPLLTPELLFVLAAMGHGDEIAVVDANFPADSVADSTCHGQVVSLPGTSMPQVVGSDPLGAAFGRVRRDAGAHDGSRGRRPCRGPEGGSGDYGRRRRPPLVDGGRGTLRFLRGRAWLLCSRANR